jgi:hypothetical protein
MAAGADVLLNAATQKFAAQAIKEVAEPRWKLRLPAGQSNRRAPQPGGQIGLNACGRFRERRSSALMAASNLVAGYLFGVSDQEVLELLSGLQRGDEPSRPLAAARPRFLRR